MRPIMLHGHSRPLTQIKFNREGDLLFTAARDKSPNVWFSHNGERLGTFDGHNGAVTCLDVDQHTQFLLTGAADNTCKIWNCSNGKELFSLDFKTGVRSVEFALGDRMFLVLTDSRSNIPATLSVYKLTNAGTCESQTPLQSIVIPGSAARVARWGALNKFILIGHEDGTITSWEPLTGKKQNSIRPHGGQITDIQFCADKTHFITASKDMTSRVFDSESLEEVRCYQADRPLNSASLSPLKEQIVCGGGQEARDVTTTSARAGRFEICFFDRVYSEEIGRLKGHFGPVNTLAFHPSGKSLCSGGEDGYVRIYHFDHNYLNYGQ